MSEQRKHPNHHEYVALGVARNEPERDPVAEQRGRDLCALAQTAEGKRIFGWLIAKDRAMGFRGNSEDAYRLGRHIASLQRYEAWRVQKGQEQIKAWENEIKSHPEYGGVKLDKSVETAKNMLHRYGSPELTADFDRMGVLAHPEFFKFLMNVSKDVSEGVSIGGAGQAMPETSAAKVLYPDFK